MVYLGSHIGKTDWPRLVSETLSVPRVRPRVLATHPSARPGCRGGVGVLGIIHGGIIWGKFQGTRFSGIQFSAILQEARFSAIASEQSSRDLGSRNWFSEVSEYHFGPSAVFLKIHMRFIIEKYPSVTLTRRFVSSLESSRLP